MKTFLIGLLSLSALMLLSGCGEEAKTKEYYLKHLDEAEKRVQECKKLEKSNEVQKLDCGNALLATMSKTTNFNSDYYKSADSKSFSLGGEKK